jgi:hypothetical protein
MAVSISAPVFLAMSLTFSDSVAAEKRGRASYRSVHRTAAEDWAQSIKEPAQGYPLVQAAARRLEWVLDDLEPDQEKPTDRAVDRYYAFFAGLAQWGTTTIPTPHVSSVGNGDLFTEWEGTARDVVLRIAPDGDVRLHRIEVVNGTPGFDRTIPNPTIRDLREALVWFSQQPGA